MLNNCLLQYHFYHPGFLFGLSGAAGLFVLCMYFLPTIIAIIRKKNNTGSILILNLFLGWTFIGWIVSLVWAVSANTQPQQVIINNNMPVEKRTTPVMLRPTAPARKEQPVPTNVVASQQDRINQLQQLKELLDNGVLTQEEFNQQKAKILAA